MQSSNDFLDTSTLTLEQLASLKEMCLAISELKPNLDRVTQAIRSAKISSLHTTGASNILDYLDRIDFSLTAFQRNVENATFHLNGIFGKPTEKPKGRTG